MRVNIFGATAIAMIGMSTAVMADDYLDCWNFYAAEDYSNAVGPCTVAAAQDNGAAQTILAAMYEAGQGVPQDYTEALRLYKSAAEQGYIASQKS